MRCPYTVIWWAYVGDKVLFKIKGEEGRSESVGELRTSGGRERRNDKVETRDVEAIDRFRFGG